MIHPALLLCLLFHQPCVYKSYRKHNQSPILSGTNPIRLIWELETAPAPLLMTQLQLWLQVFSISALVVSTGSSTISIMHLHLLVVHLLFHHLLHIL